MPPSRLLNRKCAFLHFGALLTILYALNPYATWVIILGTSLVSLGCWVATDAHISIRLQKA
jgi:hypothetical protein